MSDILASVYCLDEKPNTMPLLDLLKEAFADSTDFKAVSIGAVEDNELYLCYFKSLCSSQKLDYLLGEDNGGNLSVRLARYSGTDLMEGIFNAVNMQFAMDLQFYAS